MASGSSCPRPWDRRRAGAIVFQVLTQVVAHYALSDVAGFHAGEHAFLEHGDEPFSPWMLVGVCVAGGLASGVIVYSLAPEAEGHGTDAAIDSFHNKGGAIRSRIPFVKTIASALTIGTGGSGGREGPIAQIGSGFGSFLATRHDGVRPALGALLTVLAGRGLWWAFDRDNHALAVLATGYGTLRDTLLNATDIGVPLLLAIAGVKILTTSFTIGSGGSGGVSGPSMVIGGCLGATVGAAFHEL